MIWTKRRSGVLKRAALDCNNFQHPPSERLDRLLMFGIAEQNGIGGVFSPYEAAACGATHSQSTAEVVALANALMEEGLLDKTDQQDYLRVTPRGYILAREKPRSASQNGFIAMWFDPAMNAARLEGLEPAIRDAGYNPVVVSGVEHINKIDDEIVSQIRKSRFLVADLTGHRGGVYFEAGFALGLGCRFSGLVGRMISQIVILTSGNTTA